MPRHGEGRCSSAPRSSGLRRPWACPWPGRSRTPAPACRGASAGGGAAAAAGPGRADRVHGQVARRSAEPDRDQPRLRADLGPLAAGTAKLEPLRAADRGAVCQRQVVGPLQPERDQGRLPDLRSEHLHEPVGDQRHALRGPPHSHRQRSQRRQSQQRRRLRRRGPAVPQPELHPLVRAVQGRYGLPAARLGVPGDRRVQLQLPPRAGERRRQHRRARGDRPRRGLRQPAGALRRVPPRRSHPELRLRLHAAGDPGLHQRLPGLHLHRQQPRRTILRQPGLQPAAVQRRVLPAAREGHEQRSQYPVRDARPARRHRQLLLPGLPRPGLHGPGQRPLPARLGRQPHRHQRVRRAAGHRRHPRRPTPSTPSTSASRATVTSARST